MLAALLLVATPLAGPGSEAARPGTSRPPIVATFSVVGGYDWAASSVHASAPTFQLPAGPESSLGIDVGGELFAHLGGPLYVGALVDYGVVGPDALLVAGGLRLALGPAAIAGGIGYASVSEGGYGALLALDFDVARGFAVRVAGSWRKSSFTVTQDSPAATVESTTTVWSLLGGLAVHL